VWKKIFFGQITGMRVAYLLGPAIFLAFTLHSVTYTVDTSGDASVALGGVQTGAQSGNLRYVINAINADSISTANTYTIQFGLGAGQETITLQGILPPLNMFNANTLVIDGSNNATGGSMVPITIHGNNLYRGLFAQSGDIQIQNLTIQNCKAQGGTGSGGGGGIGGGLFVNAAQTTLTQVTIQSNNATGGTGTGAEGQGGGGLGGNGGTSNVASSTFHTGGGGGGFSGNGGSAVGSGNTTPGAGGGGGGGSLGSGVGGAGGLFGGGGGSGVGLTGGSGGIGGGAGGSGAVDSLGNGGGGGGADGAVGANGGFGGGGGFSGGVGGIGAGSEGGGGGGLGGGVFINNTGTLILSNGCSVNLNSVTAGTGAAAQNGAAVGANYFVREGGTLNFAPTTGTMTVSQVIADSSRQSIPSGMSYTPGTLGSGGAVTKSEAGTLVLSAVNTYSGGTIVSGGTLSIGSETNIGGSTASLTLQSGTLLTTGAVTTSGAVDVTGSFDINASGGAVTFTDTMSGSDGAVLSSSGNLSLNTIQVASGTFTISGNLTGTQPLTKTGSGSLVLTGTNSYNGNTTVSAGFLEVDGSLTASSTTVSSWATLSGTGTVQAIHVLSGGTVSPGTPLSVLSGSSVIFDSGALFGVVIDPTSASRLHITGGATLAGSVTVSPEAGNYSALHRYLILDAGSISGSFSSVSSTNPGFIVYLSQIGNDIYLFAQSPDVFTSGLTGNALRIAEYLNSGAPLSVLLLFEDFNQSQIKSTMDAISPSSNGSAVFTSQYTLLSVSRLLSSHINDRRNLKSACRINGTGSSPLCMFRKGTPETVAPECAASDSMIPDRIFGKESSRAQFVIWAAGLGEKIRQDGSNQNPSIHFDSAASLIGFDYLGYDRKNLVGSAVGYAYTRYKQGEDKGNGHVNYFYGSIYANLVIDSFYISPALWLSYDPIDNTRRISFTGFSKDAKADIPLWQAVPHLELGYIWNRTGFGMTPFTVFDWVESFESKYVETGASPFNARKKSRTSALVRSETGLKFLETWEHEKFTLLLTEQASYVFIHPVHSGKFETSFVGIPGQMSLATLNQTMNLGAIGLDMTFSLGRQRLLTLSLGYNGEFGSSYISNELSLILSRDF
jgi:uncharacterized protein with beta-barrel porin domain